MGRVTAKNVGGQVTSFTYDTEGRLLRATNPDVTLAFERDRLGQVTAETCNGRTMAFTHDALGRRSSRTTPTGATSTWTYDTAGRRTTLSTAGHTLDFERDAVGREITRHLDGLVTLAHTWDATGRLTAQSVTSGSESRAVQHRAYTYRADGNLTAVDDRLSGLRTFDLDPTGRVTAVHAHGWTERYTYDEAGNQSHADWPRAHPSHEATGPRAYTGTRITRAGNVRYEHDAHGRVTLRQKSRLSRKPETWHYEWDAEDRLSSVTTPDGTVWRYMYDPLGRRIAKERLTVTGQVAEQTYFTWDGPTLAEQTTSSAQHSNLVTLTWDHDGTRPLAQSERITVADAPQQQIDARFFAIVTDLVGTPSELIDESGHIAWRTRATLWGTTTWPRESTAYTPLRFPGQYFDPESGLHYNFHRYYDPETARYTTPDPLGLAPAPNPLTYVRNPHSWIDSLGLAPECEVSGNVNGGSWDPAESPYIYRGVSYADNQSPEQWVKAYEDALNGHAIPRGGHSDVQVHVGGDEGTNSVFTSWTTDLEDVARESSSYGNGPGVVLRMPNGDGLEYSRVPGVHYPYDESEVTIRGPIRGAEISIGGGPWHRVN